MSATVETSIWNALAARIALLPTSIVPQSSVALPLAEFEKPTDSNGPLPYIEVDYLPNVNQRVMIPGGRPQRRTGILQLTYCEPIKNKLTFEQVTQVAGAIVQHFPEDLAMRYNGVLVRVERTPDVARGMEDYGYWRTPISIRYDCFA